MGSGKNAIARESQIGFPVSPDLGLNSNHDVDVPVHVHAGAEGGGTHLMQGDVSGLVEDAVQLNFLPKDVDRESLVPVLQRVFDSAQLAATDQVRAGLQFQSIQSRRKQFWAVSMDLNRIFYLYPFLVPDYFALITRAMIVLEGIAITGDPSFDLFRSAYPYSLRRAVSVFGYRGVVELAREATKLMGEMGLPKSALEDLGGPLPLPA